MSGVPAAEYHERTKHSPESVRASGFRLDFENKPIPYKIYENRPSRPLADSIRPPQRPALAAIAESNADPLSGVEADARAAPTLDLDRLTQLCYFSGGVTKNFADRELDIDPRSTPRDELLHAVQQLYHAASTTGKLYHVDLYLVCGDLPDLPAGVYHFDPLTCSLDELRDGDYRGVLSTATGGDAGVADAPLTVVTASTWWRNAWKYRERTFRHAFWDSGTTLANLLAVAHALDHRAEVVVGFADGPVADLLGVDPTEEAPLELVAIGRDSPAPDPRSVSTIETETRPASPDPKDYPLISDAWRAGTLPDGDAARAWREGDFEPPVGTRSPGDGDRVPLDPVGPDRATSRPLHRTIRRRGSCREYLREAVSFRAVSTVLDRAMRGAPMDVRDPDGPALQFTDCYLLANGVDELPAGAYHYHPDAGELERLRGGATRREAGHLALDQRLGADAALSVYFAADIEAIVDRLGDRGYRVAQLEAALTAGRLYLATYAHRTLGGTGLTFYDDAVTEYFEPRAAGQTPMFLYTMGRPA